MLFALWLCSVSSCVRTPGRQAVDCDNNDDTRAHPSFPVRPVSSTAAVSAARAARAESSAAWAQHGHELEASVPAVWPDPDRVRTPVDFTLAEELGRGSYAVVLRGVERASGATVAVKRVSKAHVARHGKAHEVMREKEALVELATSASQAAVVRLFFTLQDRDHLYFVLQLCTGGDLQQLLWRYGALPMTACTYYTAQLTAALSFLHARNFVHRDVKPDNILLDAHGRARLADMAASRRLACSGGRERANSFVGTPEYVAPEVLEAAPATFATDWWGLGCVLVRAATGRPPFAGETHFLLFQNIRGLHYSLPPSLPAATVDLVRQLLVVDPMQRLGIESRGGATSVQAHPFFTPLKVDWEAILEMPAPPVGAYVPPLRLGEEASGGTVEEGAMSDAKANLDDGPRLLDAWTGPDDTACALALQTASDGVQQQLAVPYVLNADDLTPEGVRRLRAAQASDCPWLPLVNDSAAVLLALPAWRRHGMAQPVPVMLVLSTDARLHVRVRDTLDDAGTVRLTAACSADAWGPHALLVYSPRRVHYFELAAADASLSQWEDGGAAPALRLAEAICSLVARAPAPLALEESLDEAASSGRGPVAF